MPSPRLDADRDVLQAAAQHFLVPTEIVAGETKEGTNIAVAVVEEEVPGAG
ncbi:hypothetical protein [Mycobacterium sp. URHB0021]